MKLKRPCSECGKTNLILEPNEEEHENSKLTHIISCLSCGDKCFCRKSAADTEIRMVNMESHKWYDTGEKSDDGSSIMEMYDGNKSIYTDYIKPRV